MTCSEDCQGELLKAAELLGELLNELLTDLLNANMKQFPPFSYKIIALDFIPICIVAPSHCCSF